ncbi:MAG: hypothetical protein JW965_10800 [Bacteroidales bacterium]|nr:hypothetical protein [Bacteroidales bacterium]
MKRLFYKFLILLLFFLVSDIAFSQKYFVGNTSVEAVDSTRNNRKIELLIYYPADSAGRNVPVSSAPEDGFPVISFGHGYRMPVSYYENIWTSIVPEGYILVLPDSETEMFPSHREFGLDILYATGYMLEEGNDPGSIFYGKVGNTRCLMGHSLGGGSAILGAAIAGDVQSLIVLAPLDTRPSSATAAGSVDIPALVFTGSHDFITPARKHALPIYESLGGRWKTYINITGGNHCNMAMKYRLCDFAERTRPENQISREKQHEILNRYILPWLAYTLKGIESEAEVFNSLIESDASITYKRDKPLGMH